MEIESLHFFHGFLGETEDWAEVERHLLLQASVKIYKHSLIEDLKNLKEDFGFEQWALYKQDQLNHISGSKGLVGYSLGGRLAMHLSLQSTDKVLLLACHPGLEAKKEERLEADQSWIEKGLQLTQEKWLNQWNQQEVFRNDQVRPERQFDKKTFQLWQKSLVGWSLAQQTSRDFWIEQSKGQVFWACGDRDKKFLKLKKEKMNQLLPTDHLLSIENSGHGVIFDNPKNVAQLIKKVLLQ